MRNPLFLIPSTSLCALAKDIGGGQWPATSSKNLAYCCVGGDHPSVPWRVLTLRKVQFSIVMW